MSNMTLERIIEILTIHNNWRRGSDVETPYTIKELGEAIEGVVNILKGLTKPEQTISNKELKGLINQIYPKDKSGKFRKK
jgi:hypothetical protein